jgi:hypothetical protein
MAASIEDYGLIGDCESAALVSKDKNKDGGYALSFRVFSARFCNTDQFGPCLQDRTLNIDKDREVYLSCSSLSVTSQCHLTVSHPPSDTDQDFRRNPTPVELPANAQADQAAARGPSARAEPIRGSWNPPRWSTTTISTASMRTSGRSS